MKKAISLIIAIGMLFVITPAAHVSGNGEEGENVLYSPPFESIFLDESFSSGSMIDDVVISVNIGHRLSHFTETGAINDKRFKNICYCLYVINPVQMAVTEDGALNYMGVIPVAKVEDFFSFQYTCRIEGIDDKGAYNPYEHIERHSDKRLLFPYSGTFTVPADVFEGSTGLIYVSFGYRHQSTDEITLGFLVMSKYMYSVDEHGVVMLTRVWPQSNAWKLMEKIGE